MNLDMLPEVLAYLLSLVTAIDPGALALGTLGAGLAWRAVRRLRPTAKALFPLTRWLRRKPATLVVEPAVAAEPSTLSLATWPFLRLVLLGLLALALDLAILPFCALAGIRRRKRAEAWEPDELAEAFAAIRGELTLLHRQMEIRVSPTGIPVEVETRLAALEAPPGIRVDDPDGHWPPLERRVEKLEVRAAVTDLRIAANHSPAPDPMATAITDTWVNRIGDDITGIREVLARHADDRAANGSRLAALEEQFKRFESYLTRLSRDWDRVENFGVDNRNLLAAYDQRTKGLEAWRTGWAPIAVTKTAERDSAQQEAATFLAEFDARYEKVDPRGALIHSSRTDRVVALEVWAHVCPSAAELLAWFDAELKRLAYRAALPGESPSYVRKWRLREVEYREVEYNAANPCIANDPPVGDRPAPPLADLLQKAMPMPTIPETPPAAEKPCSFCAEGSVPRRMETASGPGLRAVHVGIGGVAYYCGDGAPGPEGSGGDPPSASGGAARQREAAAFLEKLRVKFDELTATRPDLLPGGTKNLAHAGRLNLLVAWARNHKAGPVTLLAWVDEQLARLMPDIVAEDAAASQSGETETRKRRFAAVVERAGECARGDRPPSPKEALMASDES